MNPASSKSRLPEVEARAQLAELLVQVGCEDPKALREIYKRTAAKLFGICVRICGDRHAAEDVLQDVYMIIWRRAGAYEPGPASPITWLATIARNRAIDWRRAQRTRNAVTLDEAPDIPDPSQNAELSIVLGENSRRLQQCLAEINPRQSIAIQTAFFYGYTYAELAARDGVPLGTIKSLIRRGLRQIRLRLDTEVQI